MATSNTQYSQRLSRSARFFAHPLSRIVIATLFVALPVALTLILVQQALDKSMRQVWPQMVCAMLCIAAYVMYVKKVEKREVVEFSRVGAAYEFGFGVVIGSVAILVVLCTLIATDSFQIVSTNQWITLVSPFSEMLLVAFFEEILFRGIIFRIIEKSIGTLSALLISVVLFTLAHFPNAGITLLPIVVTAVAGLLFCAAYMVTRRLWLAVGIHFAWNFMSDAVFSLPTSGHPAKGFLQGQLSGPEWLSGGAYGIEGSLVTLVVLTIVTLWLLKIAKREDQFI
ncbi:MAG: type II CAAX endopeptidase family protein [Undibacterium sp.]|uniref:CPBP family intramembrane glutamic endopeptidase n=1 Tax=Undibacterium sp. TaxID=1914977 RepID=UPI002718699D|nr:type II CAAX endopeptidase family protein [Undibacterium sp.]MDO8653192.1 type II CAAX endopeptidase family protein [Undibacterium sp.]